MCDRTVRAQLKDTRRRHCIEQLEPFSEYAPAARRINPPASPQGQSGKHVLALSFSGFDLGCVKTCAHEKRAKWFSLLSYPDNRRQLSLSET